jgi:hypothetical protein
MKWFFTKDPTLAVEKIATVRVNSQGQTIVDANELLASDPVKKFMDSFSPKVQKYIQLAREEEAGSGEERSAR